MFFSVNSWGRHYTISMLHDSKGRTGWLSRYFSLRIQGAEYYFSGTPAARNPVGIAR